MSNEKYGLRTRNGIIRSFIEGGQFQSYQYLLDTYTGASAAYSLRKLSSTYTGSCIRVRRSSDNTEQNIGFVNNALDTASLLSFVGAGNGYVTTWYDQSGNGLNGTQGIASYQPIIVNSGSLILVNSKMALQFDGTDDYFTHLLNVNSGYSLISAVVKSLFNGSAIKGIYNFTAPYNPIMNGMMSNANGANWGLYINSFKNSGYNIYNNQTFIASYSDNLTSGVVTNNLITNNNLTTVTDTGRYAGDATNRRYIGLDVSTSYAFNGYMQEIIVYNSNQYSNLTGFRNNINSYYGIY